MFNHLATQANEIPEPPLTHSKQPPDSERGQAAILPETAYMPYAEKPGLSEPPYMPYGEKPAPDKHPYEPYKDI